MKGERGGRREPLAPGSAPQAQWPCGLWAPGWRAPWPQAEQCRTGRHQSWCLTLDSCSTYPGPVTGVEETWLELKAC